MPLETKCKFCREWRYWVEGKEGSEREVSWGQTAGYFWGLLPALNLAHHRG